MQSCTGLCARGRRRGDGKGGPADLGVHGAMAVVHAVRQQRVVVARPAASKVKHTRNSIAVLNAVLKRRVHVAHVG